MLEMEVAEIILDPTTNMPIVILKSKEGKGVLPIWVGIFEALAISQGLKGIHTPRPLTHDLIKLIVENLKAKIIKVGVTDLQGNTFFAQITLKVRGKTINIDARPSDAIAIALRTKVPIYAAEKVIKGARTVDRLQEIEKENKHFLENLEEGDFGKYKM